MTARGVWQALKQEPVRDVVDATVGLALPIANLPAVGAARPDVMARLASGALTAEAARTYVDAGALRANHSGLLFSLDLFGTTHYALGTGVLELYAARDALLAELVEPDHGSFRERVAVTLGSPLRRDVSWYLATQTEPRSTVEVFDAVHHSFIFEGAGHRELKVGTRQVWSHFQVLGALDELREARFVKSVYVGPSMRWVAAPFHRTVAGAPSSLREAYEALGAAAPPDEWGPRLDRLAAVWDYGIIEQLTTVGRSARVIGAPGGLSKEWSRRCLELLEKMGIARRTRVSNTDHWFSTDLDPSPAMMPIDHLARHVARDIHLTPWPDMIDVLSVRSRLQVLAALVSVVDDGQPGRMTVEGVERATGMDRSTVFSALGELSRLGLVHRAALLEYSAHPRIAALLGASKAAGIDARPHPPIRQVRAVGAEGLQ